MEIKGIKEGILVTLEEQEWQEAKDALIGKIKEKGDFFKGAQLVFDVGNKVLSANELGEVCDLLMAHDVILHGVISKSLVTQKVAKEMGLVTKVEKPRLNSERQLKPLETVFSGEPAVFIRRTLRSGFKVAYQGHVIVLGDVNPGAEIVATGSVIVWGRLRGTVHAGAEGDQAAVVCALDLSPTQLRIASKITTTPQEQVESKPEIASIVDGQIIAEPWKH
jgi:septum site-determining protein MinC